MIEQQKQPETISEEIKEKSEVSESPNQNSDSSVEDNSTTTSTTNLDDEATKNLSSEVDSPSSEATVVDENLPETPDTPDTSKSEATESSPESINNDEIISLKEQLEKQIQEKDAIKSQYMRIAADFENFRKRTTKEKEELEHTIKSKTITELLVVVDNFERARTQIKPANDGEMSIHRSYQGVYKNLVDTLKRLGVSAMKPEGEPFDPNFHEAMLREPTNEYAEGVVMEQLVRGYLLGDRVLRHAMVKVAASMESEEETTETPETQNP